MRGRIAANIRKQHNLSQADFAKKLGVSLRTITNWETSGAELPVSIAYQLRTTYQESYLGDALIQLGDKAFAEIPSEMVNIWVVEGPRCILLTGGERLADGTESELVYTFDRTKRRDVWTPTLLIPLEQESLTTFPLRTGVTLNLHEFDDGIKNHAHKRHKGTDVAIYSLCGRCRSLLYIPVFEPSGWGPMPVFSLCFQNKLTESMELPKKQPPRYTTEDEQRGRSLAEANKTHIVQKLIELDMLEPNRQV
jgi:transcriptional regulator with XRE-family HTH domain